MAELFPSKNGHKTAIDSEEVWQACFLPLLPLTGSFNFVQYFAGSIMAPLHFLQSVTHRSAGNRNGNEPVSNEFRASGRHLLTKIKKEHVFSACFV